MTISPLLRLAAVLLIGAGLTAAHPARAQDVYAGKEISIVLPTGPGGGWAFTAQLIAETMPKYIPGGPRIVPQFMPGASGVKMMNFLANAAPQDGTHLGLPLKDVATTQMMIAEARFDVRKFHWIGRVAPVRTTLVVWHTAPATTVAAARLAEVIFAAQGKSDQSSMNPLFMNAIAGTRFRVVTGYRGSADAFLAMERGEAHGWSGAWDATASQRADWVREKKLVPLVQLSLTRAPDLPDVPLLMEYATGEEQRSMVDFMTAGAEIGRSLIAPPGVPAKNVAILRRAFAQAMTDEALIARAAKAKLAIEPLSGPEIATVVEKIVSIRPATLKKVEDAIR